MAELTPRRNLEVPEGTDYRSTHGVGPEPIRAAIEAMDDDVVFAMGNHSSRPAAAMAGRIWLSSDTGQVFIDTGSGWTEIARVAQSVPTGVILSTLNMGTAPAGWLLCRGQGVASGDGRDALRTMLNNMAAPWGFEGSNPRLPDLRGRTIIGAGQGSGLSDRAFSSMIGAEGVALATAQLPAHSHSTPNHTHPASAAAVGDHTHGVHSAGAHEHNVSVSGLAIYGGNAGFPAGSFAAAVLNAGQTNPGSVYGWAMSAGGHAHGMNGAGGHSHAITVGSGGASTSGAAGSGQEHPNMQPSAVLEWLVKL